MTFTKFATAFICLVTTFSFLAKEVVAKEKEVKVQPFGNWTQNKSFLLSTGIRVSSKNGPNTSHVYKDPSTRFTTKDGYCYLSSVRGHFRGGAEHGYVHTDAYGNWDIKAISGGSIISIEARCVWIK